jgi:hypothetical protein
MRWWGRLRPHDLKPVSVADPRGSAPEVESELKTALAAPLLGEREFGWYVDDPSTPFTEMALAEGLLWAYTTPRSPMTARRRNP